ncbi:NAD(P)H-dependent glycerol-3-phosphate dehydrogenase [Phyllobacterium endophyticum]|uniref:Glycerol-3-phosphate dehydrogenase [NAD(P)+] n=1 Tax=Phyllobacterium endophyticum TaxID=1149773 RepID=A0A2P7AYX8_9HYPH|nr:NAD(P)H-dependent glycerol-3-phosphate dehydrogenase [Phyllobacterium endophyticum]MBB3236021.1 glycerol-3-phosphate dehydrogenase (NAD(P)+) [Phyllobacterium endophyticum]PSH59409.1 glycerol-3-phosphate dehydrogenase [Phyllobacterium endophyticum]TYR41542.1 NAD(P)H-dependent glycerol-3-phosphate dehydrogenase [Phyllobacterium endophyticum]
MSTIAVLGGGAWGTALGSMAARHGNEVKLYARDVSVVESINSVHRNERYLPGIDLYPKLAASTDAAEVLRGCDLILCVIPAQALTHAIEGLKALIPVDTPLVICAKGIERASGSLPSGIVARILPNQKLGALSGPSFATDVANGLPTAVTVAARDQLLADTIAAALSGRTFRCYSTDDLIGVEIGGALKNVLAIAAGAAIGRGYGASAQAALVTRGFVELRRIAQSMGARPETIMGLSGLGDLMLTCATPQSRNYSYGLAIGRGEDLSNRPLAEGVATAAIAAELAAGKDIEAPIIAAVAQILDRQITIDEAMEALLARPLKTEN